MARVALVDRDDFDPELAAMVAGLADDLQLGHIRVFAHVPEVARQWLRLLASLAATGTLPRRLVELVRLRIAFHNQCPRCMAVRFEDGVEDGVTEELVCSLEQPEEAADLTEAERAALRYADLTANDHLRVDEALFDDLRRHFTEAEIVELGLNIAVCLGFGRIANGWQVTDDLPDRYRDPGAGLRFEADGIVMPSRAAEPAGVVDGGARPRPAQGAQGDGCGST